MVRDVESVLPLQMEQSSDATGSDESAQKKSKRDGIAFEELARATRSAEAKLVRLQLQKALALGAQDPEREAALKQALMSADSFGFGVGS